MMALVALSLLSIACSSSSSSVVALARASGFGKTVAPSGTKAPSTGSKTPAQTKSASTAKPASSGSKSLPVSQSMLEKGKDPWFLGGGATTNAVVQGSELRVKNVANGYSTKSGTNMQYKPFGALPARGAKMSYEVFFEPGWCWGQTSQGGKLPGFEFASPGASGGTGGKWSPNAGSCRPMWGKDGALNLYVYYNKTSNTDESRRNFAEQAPGFESIASVSGTAGQRLWEKGDPFSKKLEVGKWHTIGVEMVLNTPGQHDGVAALSIDGETNRYDKMFWRSTADQVVDTLAFSVWHGGSSSGWGCPTDVFVKFRNFTFSTV